MSKKSDLVGLLKYAMAAGKNQAAAQSPVRVQLRQKVASFLKRAAPGDWGKAFSSPTMGGFVQHAYSGTPGWAKALGLLGLTGAGVGAAAHYGNELAKRYDPGVDPSAKGIGMDRNLRNALTEQTAKATSWAYELGGMQHAMRNAYAPLYQ